jgi:hypothetical protein
MNVTDKLSNEQIHDIAETVDAMNHTCFINPDTGEYFFMMSSDSLADYGIYWDDALEEGEVDAPDESWPEWQKEMYHEVKADMNKFYEWAPHIIRIEKPESHEAFGFMERFVDEVIPEGKLKRDFQRALSRSHPFRDFNAIVHNCDYREEWFTFKQAALEEYVRGVINGYR